jgi:CRP-like cAMP-binding protein
MTMSVNAHERTAAGSRTTPVAWQSWNDVLSAPVVWPAGGYLFRQGDAPEQVYLLEEGFVKIVSVQEDGRESLIDLKPAGTMLGITAVMGRRAHRVSAMTGSKCVLRWCSSRVFNSALQEQPGRLRQVLETVCDDAEMLTDRVISLSLKSSKQRLLREIQNEAQDARRDTRSIRDRLKHVELASLIAVTPEHLSRILKEMSAEGMIHRQERRITMRASCAPPALAPRGVPPAPMAGFTHDHLPRQAAR